MNPMSDLFHEKVSFSYSLGRVLAERVSAATLAKMIRQKETFLLALCTHIATHTRQWKVKDGAFRPRLCKNPCPYDVPLDRLSGHRNTPETRPFGDLIIANEQLRG